MNKILSIIEEIGRIVLRGKLPSFGIRYFLCKEEGFLKKPIVFFWILTGRFPSILGFRYSNYGLWLSGQKYDTTYGYCLESYRNDLHKVLAGIKSETAFVDIGANIGVFSLIARKNKNITSIFSFEPDPITYSFLNRNANLWSSRKLEIFNVAIGSSSRKAFLSQHEKHSGAASIVSDTNDGQKAKVVNMIGPQELNHLLVQTRVPLFIKIDVEGFELEVLKSLVETDFFFKISAFFIEFDVDMGDVELVSRLLTEHGFSEIFRVGETRHWDALWERGNRSLYRT